MCCHSSLTSLVFCTIFLLVLLLAAFIIELRTKAKPLCPAQPRVVDLDLWADGNSEHLPLITVTGSGLRFEGTEAEFNLLVKKLLND